MPARAIQDQDMLPVFGPSLTGDGSPRCRGRAGRQILANGLQDLVAGLIDDHR